MEINSNAPIEIFASNSRPYQQVGFNQIAEVDTSLFNRELLSP